MKTLVLGLGNDILADDAVGILAARALKERLAGLADVQETSWHGVALLELFIGYERAILLDAVMTGKHAPGTLIEIKPEELAPIQGASPHFTGLPEMIAMARELELEFPKNFRIFAVEVADPHTIGGEMTPAVRAAIPALCDRVCGALGQPPASKQR
jgi:hydrogenase maturation protease